MDAPEATVHSEDERVQRWAERLAQAPEIDIDFWALLVEARILQA